MKKLCYTLMMSVVLVTLSASAAQAQTNSPARVIAKIPFAFTVGKTSLPAGKYTFSVVNPASDRKVLQIRSVDGHASVMVLTNSVKGIVTENAKLVFERYDDQYYFTRAQMAGEDTSFAALWSKSERKQMIAKAAKKSVIVISAG
ncbi:MAG TPA: hypothetical protein VJ306_00820 [Pyrinomonadaceae bacterium]|jgi:hypothetical protein|nr:hypothetical protein [Pyrinomonadaceae bacterium]